MIIIEKIIIKTAWYEYINVSEVQKEIVKIDSDLAEIRVKMAMHLKELGVDV